MVTREKRADYYFTCDVDNYIMPNTLTNLVKENVPIIAPMLKYADDHMELEEMPPGYWNYTLCGTYSNFTNIVNFAGDIFNVKTIEEYPDGYINILNQLYPGLYPVELIHQVYLIRRDVVNSISYQTGFPWAYDYINLAGLFRTIKIPQLLDNREVYGYFTLTENQDACRRYMDELKLNK
jgi:hypothetical protein